MDAVDGPPAAEDDRRNVVDRYRGWTVEAIVADLDTRRHPFHVAMENLTQDRNLGTIVRTANAANVAGVHVVGRRRWNRRGAMVTDAYLHLHHHPDVDAFVAWARDRDLPVVGVDIVPGSRPLEADPLPRRCVLVFGHEGEGLSAPMRAACDDVRHLPQYGSTRSINVGVAAGVAMYAWLRTWAGDAP